ncbi:MAG: tail fiber domain-containing protein [Flavobacteriales bacterium]|nr:MAG: tail fiber domain-containing protein [Flavobacteriales bacterium]
MRSDQLKSMAMAMAMAFSSGFCIAQTTESDNNASFPTSYTGWDAASSQPLRVMHNGNYPIQWWTDSLHRMQLYHTMPLSTINGFANIKRNGYLAVSPVENFYANPGPFTRLHLVDSGAAVVNYAQDFGFRPWMRNGVTMTGNSDQMYIGHKYAYVDSTDYTSGEINDRSDAVIEWSDNPDDSPWGTDRLRFMFTNDYQVSSSKTYGARSLEGMEAMRIHIPTDTTANVGIGDFFRAGVINGQIEDPTEKLHVNDGTVRIDSLIPDYNNDTLTRVVMADGTGRLHWRRISTWPQPPGGGGDCDWTADPATNRLYTAHIPVGTGAANCPEKDWKVGVGTSAIDFKLDVRHTEEDVPLNGGINSEFFAEPTGWSYGIFTKVKPVSSSLWSAAGVQSEVAAIDEVGYGVYGIANSASPEGVTVEINGVYGLARTPTDGSILTRAYGARGQIEGRTGGTTANAYGLYGKSANSGGTLQNSYGCYGFSSISSGSSTRACGLYGESTVNSSGTTTDSYGVYARSGGSVSVPPRITNSYGLYAQGVNGVNNYSVYGVAPTGGTTNWAGFFTGPIMVNSIVVPCDEQLKTNVEDVEDAVGLLMQLRPRTYTYRHEEYPQMALPQGVRYGFLSGEVQSVLPQLTRPVHQPEVLDSLGGVETAGVDFLGMSPLDIIPLTVGAIQEQQRKMVAQDQALTAHQATIEDLLVRLDHLEQALAACCANPDGGRVLQQPTPAPTVLPVDDATGDDKLRIQPNPFNEGTTVFYTLDRGGRTQLLANSSDGRDLRVLQEAHLEAGSYQYQWNTASLAPGMYYVTLLLDGQPVVKKAVKVDR